MQLSFEWREAETLRLVRDSLVAVHGPARDLQRHAPGSQLFKAIISSETRDGISEAAFQRLRVAFQNWNLLAGATYQEVFGCIKATTHAERKAEQLIETAKIIVTERGAIELRFLRERTVDYAMKWLLRLPGVGPKCAAATLNFSSLRMRTFVVDRHVLRLSIRLGLVPAKAGFDKAHRLLMNLMPDSFDSDDLYELHWLMKAHGQTVCTFAAPRCSICVLSDLCVSRSCRTKHKRIH